MIQIEVAAERGGGMFACWVDAYTGASRTYRGIMFLDGVERVVWGEPNTKGFEDER